MVKTVVGEETQLKLDEDRVFQSGISAQVSRMLLGGMQVVKVYVWASEISFRNSTLKLWQDSPRKKTNRHNRKSLDGGNSRIGSLLPIIPKKWCNKKKRSVRIQVGRSGSTFCSDIPLNTCQTVITDGVITNTDVVTAHRPVGLLECDPSDIPDVDSLELELSSAFQLNPERIPEGHLYNFRDKTTREKFKPGQVWAVYCDLDDLPKYYVQVKTVEMYPDFKVEVNWLQSCAPPNFLIRCNDEDMPLSCVVFEIGETLTFDDTTHFSHQLTGVSNATENEFEIFPRKNEVWALYKTSVPVCHLRICRNTSMTWL